MSNFLTENGIASYAVRVAGHGTNPEDLAETSREDSYASVLNGLELVKSWNPEHIFVLGFSMGGALTLSLAAEEDGIDGIILISPAIMLTGFAVKVLPILKRIIKYRSVDLEAIPKLYGYDLTRTKYDREPLEAYHQLVKLTREVQSRISEVSTPALVIQGTADKTISPDNGPMVHDLLSSDMKELQLIEGAPHVIPCHPSRTEAYSHVLPFIKKVIDSHN